MLFDILIKLIRLNVKKGINCFYPFLNIFSILVGTTSRTTYKQTDQSSYETPTNKESTHMNTTIQSPTPESTRTNTTIQSPTPESTRTNTTIQSPTPKSTHTDTTIQSPTPGSSTEQDRVLSTNSPNTNAFSNSNFVIALNIGASCFLGLCITLFCAF